MTTFWSTWICVLTLGSLIGLTWLLVGTRKGETKGSVDQTMGHAFDGIEEYDNPLPQWWFMLVAGTLVFAVGYLILYPGLGNWKGVLPGYEDGWTQTKEWDKEMAKADARFGPIFAKFAAMPVEEVAKDPQALKMGGRLFASNCAVCHGSDAKGAKSFPNLTDGDWIHGGSPEKIIETITHGRNGQMPPLGAAVGTPEEARQVANYVLSLSGAGHNSIQAELGKAKFKAVCAACHGADGKGNQAIGAPNLSDKIWLHGWGEQFIVEMINKGKVNVMPAQNARLSEDQIRLVASYVWGLSHPTQSADAK